MICGACLDGNHKCWPGDCDCTICSKPIAKTPKLVKHADVSLVDVQPKRRKSPAGPLSPELEDYVARQLLEDSGSPHRISQPEWDAVHARTGWTHREVSTELGITYERVRYIRAMPRPEDDHLAPTYRDIAYRSGCTHNQVYTVMRRLVQLRDGSKYEAYRPPSKRPAESCTFS